MLKFPVRIAKRLALIGFSLFFVVAGVNHFLNPNFYVQIMPPYLPAHLELVYLSGVLVFLKVAIFPANVHRALNPDLFPGMSPVALYLRLPFQALPIAWAYWATRPDTAASDPAAAEA